MANNSDVQGHRSINWRAFQVYTIVLHVCINPAALL